MQLSNHKMMVLGLGFRVRDIRVEGLRISVFSLWFRVWGLWFRACG